MIFLGVMKDMSSQTRKTKIIQSKTTQNSEISFSMEITKWLENDTTTKTSPRLVCSKVH